MDWIRRFVQQPEEQDDEELEEQDDEDMDKLHFGKMEPGYIVVIVPLSIVLVALVWIFLYGFSCVTRSDWYPKPTKCDCEEAFNRRDCRFQCLITPDPVYEFATWCLCIASTILCALIMAIGALIMGATALLCGYKPEDETEQLMPQPYNLSG